MKSALRGISPGEAESPAAQPRPRAPLKGVDARGPPCGGGYARAVENFEARRRAERAERRTKNRQPEGRRAERRKDSAGRRARGESGEKGRRKCPWRGADCRGREEKSGPPARVAGACAGGRWKVPRAPGNVLGWAAGDRFRVFLAEEGRSDFFAALGKRTRSRS